METKQQIKDLLSESLTDLDNHTLRARGIVKEISESEDKSNLANLLDDLLDEFKEINGLSLLIMSLTFFLSGGKSE